MKHKIQFLQFYISNTCNLACPHCLSFNNLAFKGHFKFDKVNAAQWASLIDPYEVAIIGGEPFTNPYLDEWVDGLHSTFQCEDFRITTNGTYLEAHTEKVLRWIEMGVNIDISSHSIADFENHHAWAKKHLGTLIQHEYEEEYNHNVYRYSNGKGWCQVRTAYYFVPNAVKEIKDGIVYMHNNSPQDAHSGCSWRDCHYIVDGRLYKCCVTAAGPMLTKQFNLDNNSRQILEKTKSLSPLDNTATIDYFLETIEDSCDQCALCPINPISNLHKFELPKKKEKV